jgi:predicted RNase H-like HicB family nuclease
MVHTFTAAVHAEDDWCVARCLEPDVASQGETLEEALMNLREAMELYLDEDEQPTIEATPLVTSFQVDDAAWAPRSLIFRTAR